MGLLLTASILFHGGCKSPRNADHALAIRFEPTPSPPITVEHRASYARFYLVGWSLHHETLGRYASDTNGQLLIENIDPDRDWLIIDDPRYLQVRIGSGSRVRPMTARSYDEETLVTHTIGIEVDGTVIINPIPRQHE